MVLLYAQKICVFSISCYLYNRNCIDTCLDPFSLSENLRIYNLENI